ncbi:MAG: hypothetical protein ACI8QD_000533 [Cyclobacteriaceae bacterium]|jgi:hypothetical protein
MKTMRKNNLTKELAEMARYQSATGGGRVMAKHNFLKKGDCYQLTVSVASVPVEYLVIEIVDMMLLVFQQDTLSQQKIPLLVYSIMLPFDVDPKQISARANEHGIAIELPFNDLAGGYHRSVEIEK